MFPETPHSGLPLSGLRVVDCTIWQQGTYASAMLGDFGADVSRSKGPIRPTPGGALARATSRATTATSAASSST